MIGRHIYACGVCDACDRRHVQRQTTQSICSIYMTGRATHAELPKCVGARAGAVAAVSCLVGARTQSRAQPTAWPWMTTSSSTHLCGRVVAPDDDVLHLCHMHTSALGNLQCVVDKRHKANTCSVVGSVCVLSTVNHSSLFTPGPPAQTTDSTAT